MAPTRVLLRAEARIGSDSPVLVLAGLTADALWLQDTWGLQKVPLRTLDGIEARRGGKELVLTLRPESGAGRLILTFAGAAAGQYWHYKLQARRGLSPEEAERDTHLPEGVTLVREAPDVPHQVLGPVEFTGQTAWMADRGLRLRAGMRGADAVLGVAGPGARHLGGLAVRIDSEADRRRLRLHAWTESVGALVRRLLLLLGLQAAVVFLAGAFCLGVMSLTRPTGETPAEAVASSALGVGVFYTWPLVLIALLRWLRWPQLLRLTGLAVLAATTGRIVTLWLTHLLTLLTSSGPVGFPPGRAGLFSNPFGLLADPIDWAFVIAGVVLCSRAWRLAGAAPQLLPSDVQTVSMARKVWGRGLLAATGAYALAFLGFVATERYRATAYLLQPGVDPRREEQALRDLNEGADLFNKGDLVAAQQSLQHSLRLWEELTAGVAPSAYRVNLALTLNNLGLICERRGNADQAEKYYTRAVAVADGLAGDPQVNKEFQQVLDSARAALAQLRDHKVNRALEEKEKTACRKYEEAQVQADKGGAEAERLTQEAIALWEEILPQATNEEYRRAAVARLLTAYLLLAELQKHHGRRFQAEQSVKRAIDYGQKAVAKDPDRPLPKHNLEVARQMLEEVREEAFQEKIDRLCGAERYADACDLFLKAIEDQPGPARSGEDGGAARRRLAHRLDRFAWFLAHCPDERVRDTKAAVKRAGRATELQPDVGDYWYTLAVVQYRDGRWRDSLASLEMVKAREGELDASSWLLTAMNRQRLGQREEARRALRKAAQWVEEQQRKAEDNALLRLRLEMMRPGIDALRKEAERLIEGKGPGGEGVG